MALVMAGKKGIGGWIHNGYVVVTVTIVLLLVLCEMTGTINILK
jgi:hypothetical protein